MTKMKLFGIALASSPMVLGFPASCESKKGGWWVELPSWENLEMDISKPLHAFIFLELLRDAVL